MPPGDLPRDPHPYLGKGDHNPHWPSGWIGYLVRVSRDGVLALLVHRSASAPTAAITRTLVVCGVLPAGDVAARDRETVDQYGMTEPRYFSCCWRSGCWQWRCIAGSPDRPTQALPVSLCAIALFSAFGPWGAYEVAKRSQLGRFNRILAANNMGKAGALVPAREPVSLEHRRELSAILRYLGDTHGPEAVARVIGVAADTVRTGN
jgi:hypothetical protein